MRASIEKIFFFIFLLFIYHSWIFVSQMWNENFVGQIDGHVPVTLFIRLPCLLSRFGCI